MIMRITFDIETHKDVRDAITKLQALLGERAEKPTTKKAKAEKPAPEKTPEPAAAPNLTRKDLGQHLRSIALKMGTPAQEAIGQIVLAKSGTQALSQVDEKLLPAIKAAVDAWVGEQK